MSSAHKYLKLILFWHGIGFIAVGATWIFDRTEGRFVGVHWLESLLFFIPYLGVDDKVGIIWAVAGVLMVVAGSRASRPGGKLETIGYVAGVTIPILMSAIFAAAHLFGDAPHGYIASITYLLFAVPLLAYIRLTSTQLSTDTTTMNTISGRPDVE